MQEIKFRLTLGRIGVCAAFGKLNFNLGSYCGITPNRLLPAVYLRIMNIYINKSEIKAIRKAWEEINEKLEGCSGDEMEEQSLQFTLKGLRSLEFKIKKKSSVVNGR